MKKGNLLLKKSLCISLVNIGRPQISGKMYQQPKIDKRLVNVPGCPVISNCGTPTEKASEFLDHHIKPIMRSLYLTLRILMNFIET